MEAPRTANKTMVPAATLAEAQPCQQPQQPDVGGVHPQDTGRYQ